MLKKVMATITEYGMLKNGDHIIIGLSGGADSCALLSVLCHIKDSSDLKLTAVHINHCLRGEEADCDEAFAKELCERLGVEFISERADVKTYAEKNGLGSEEAGRLIRYAAFERIKAEKGATKIAVAHNINDRAETVIMRLARGSGLKGLVGISPVRGDIIRPLINCKRSEIESYCKKEGIDYRTDSTNNEDIYTRNRVRHNIIPLLEKEINKNAVFNIAKTAVMAAEENLFIEEEAQKAFNDSLINTFEKNSVYLNIDKLKKYHRVIAKRVIIKALTAVSGAQKDIYSKNVDDIYSLMDKGTGKSVDLPYDIKAETVYDTLKIGIAVNKEKKDICYSLEEGKTVYVPEMGQYVLVSSKEEKNSIKGVNVCTKSFNCAKIKDSLILRNRKTGDIVRLYPAGGSKKLKDFFIDKKIPREKRDELLVFASGNEVLWIPDIWYSKYHGLGEDTENVLYIYIWEDA
ncbi:MAG: tRNA lysidine(34) synthetase TilS [Lachnospiraceae bacterium]|nr:tRNA lysidine(34) synthetase TilS [Lachnospiraceae bacterium]